MSTYSDHVWRYREGVRTGSFDTDLDIGDRDRVVWLLERAYNMLANHGMMDSATLTRHTVSTITDDRRIVVRVSEILSGCAAGLSTGQQRPSVFGDVS